MEQSSQTPITNVIKQEQSCFSIVTNTQESIQAKTYKLLYEMMKSTQKINNLKLHHSAMAENILAKPRKLTTQNSTIWPWQRTPQQNHLKNKPQEHLN
jgi:hypothetical protein